MVAGRQHLHAFQQRAVGEEVLEGEVLHQARLVEPALEAGNRQHGLLLGAECKLLALLAVVQRLDAIAVARQQQASLAPVPQGQRKHAVEALQRGHAPGRQRIEHHLGVRLAAKPEALGFQLGAQFAKVVDLAVVAEHVAVVGVDHRLVRRGGQVDDRQAPVAQAHVALDPVALAVRPAVRNRIGHALHHNGVSRPAV